MISDTGSLKYKILTAPTKPRPSGRKLTPPPIAPPPAKPARKPANKNQNTTNPLVMFFSFGE